MFKKRMGSLLLSAVLAAGLLHTAAGPAAAQETGAGPVLPAELQTVMEEEGFTGLSSDLAADLSSIVFEKADGSRTLYMYDQPVKYRDAGGEVRFKTKKAKKTEKKNGEGRAVYAFENPDNDWKAYLPARIADGVMLEAGGYRLEIFPEAEKNSKVKQTGGEEAPVRYTDALSTQTDLTLAYTLDGLQLQMDLERYTGRNEFRFTIDPHGLTPQALASHMILFQDPQSGETVCTLNPIELRSARYEQTGSYTDVSYYNSYRLTPAENGTYTITAVLDEDFLTDPATVYPLSAETNTAWRRDTKDTTVFKDDSGNYHTSAYDYVGYYLTGRSRLRAMKLAQMDTSVLKFINPSKITNAYYNTTVGGAADSWTLQVGRPTVCWDADTVTYADVENRYDIFYSATLSNTDLTILKIPMTSLLQTWLYVELGESTSLDSRQGIILMPGSNCPQTSCRTFYSADYSVEAGRPAFVVEYTADTSLTNGYYFIRNGGCERYLDLVNGGSAVGTGTCIYNFHGRDNQLWYISLYNSSTGQYTIRPCNIGNRYLSAKNEYASPLTLSDTPCYWRLLRNGNGSYRILVDGSERQAAESASGSTENSAPVKTWGY
ncbi:MAG: RICIN domain-containing protein, partial [Clostridiales bacterium]|nr:RICIN domain-containing protein [Clostridiales bacterium]